MEEATVSLDGEFVLATGYGANPLILGLDLHDATKNPEGIVRAARFWEITHLNKKYMPIVQRLVPEARFTERPGGNFYVHLVGPEKAERILGEIELGYNIRNGQVTIALGEGTEFVSLRDVLTPETFEMKRDYELVIARQIETNEKYLDILSELDNVIPETHDLEEAREIRTSLTAFGKIFLLDLNRYRERKQMSVQDFLASLREEAEINLKAARQWKERQTDPVFVQYADIQERVCGERLEEIDLVISSEDPAQGLKDMKLRSMGEATRAEVAIEGLNMAIGLDEEFSYFMAKINQHITYSRAEVLRRKYLK